MKGLLRHATKYEHRDRKFVKGLNKGRLEVDFHVGGLGPPHDDK
jgi:hypothetical protein